MTPRHFHSRAWKAKFDWRVRGRETPRPFVLPDGGLLERNP
jgi:hypothetical protein